MNFSSMAIRITPKFRSVYIHEDKQHVTVRLDGDNNRFSVEEGKVAFYEGNYLPSQHQKVGLEQEAHLTIYNTARLIAAKIPVRNVETQLVAGLIPWLKITKPHLNEKHPTEGIEVCNIRTGQNFVAFDFVEQS